MQRAEERYDGLCLPNSGFTEHFVNLIKKDNCENIQLFLANLERNLFSNKLFDSRTNNALNYALNQGLYNSALCLINTGNANINQKNKDGYTPLMITCGQEEEITVEVAQALINQGCNVAEVNNVGRTALIRCCRYGTTPSLRIGIVLLEISRGEHQFILDHDRLSGLDYLLIFDDDDLHAKEYCQMPEYVEFVVRYLKLYFDREEKGDQVYERNIEKICRTKILYDTFGPALRRARTGINLYDVCKGLKDAGKSVQPTGVVVSGLEVPEGLTDASEIPVVVAVAESRQGVSPGGRWVLPEDQHLYQRQRHRFPDMERYKRENPSPRGPGGGPAGGKKRKTIKKKKGSTRNNKTRQHNHQ